MKPAATIFDKLKSLFYALQFEDPISGELLSLARWRKEKQPLRRTQ